MVRTETPLCSFGAPAPDFTLPGVDGRAWSLGECRGENGTIVMFICNHCPYVRAIRERLARDVATLMPLGVRAVAIMPNDTTSYPEDDLENMRRVAHELAFPFPYLLDDTQEAARRYGAVCTPDFFGYNAALQLQYRGRLDSGRLEPPPAGATRELVEGMTLVANTGRGPARQMPSMGCSIKWKTPRRPDPPEPAAAPERQ